nr:uncharacterized protein LOC105846003 isoform X2 [Hydra vulgaris]
MLIKTDLRRYKIIKPGDKTIHSIDPMGEQIDSIKKEKVKWKSEKLADEICVAFVIVKLVQKLEKKNQKKDKWIKYDICIPNQWYHMRWIVFRSETLFCSEHFYIKM